jgi:hypothetical protein
VGTLLGLAAVGCETEESARGQLVITFQTDMALPSQIDNVLVQVTRRGGNVVHMQPYSLGGTTSDNPIPGSLALVAGNEPEPITIMVAGSKGDNWRTYREIVTTVPRDRVAELRMPIQWLCSEHAEPNTVSMADGKGGTVSRVVQVCDDGYTCKAGSCVSSDTDSSTLPDFDPKKLYGGSDDPKQGTCFDVVGCMSAGTTVEPAADCSIERPAGDSINVALRVANGGICNDALRPTTCFVPLDGNDAEGWTESSDGTRINLPVAVCTKKAENKVLAVQTSTACPTKEASVPACGPWSSVPNDHAIVPESGVAPSLPAPELFATLSAPGLRLCCPLMSEAGKLYSCMCADESGGESVVFSVDMQTTRTEMFEVSLPIGSASGVLNGTLYWGAERTLYKMPLMAGASPTGFPAVGSLYRKGVLLTDETGVHMLTSGVDGIPENSPQAVQLVHFSPDGEPTGMDPLGNRRVSQIAQDATSFYAAVNVDDLMPVEPAFSRKTSVVRIDKRTHESTTLLNPRDMTITDVSFNGFLGVVSDGTDLFVLFVTEPADGLEHLQIGRVTAAATAAPSDFTAVYDMVVPSERHLTTLRLLGAVDGALLFARDEYEIDPESELQRVRSSSVLILPRGTSTPRYVADFATDLPETGIASSGDLIFWANQTGRIYSLDREALTP